MASTTNVMIAGVGGASLGTELFKCLVHAGSYTIFGCDISPTAYGLYQEGFTKTYRVSSDAYVESVVEVCKDSGASFLLPGGEQPSRLLGLAADKIAAMGIHLIGNTPEVIRLAANKDRTFEFLKKAGFPIPRTALVRERADLDLVGLPCIIKPSDASGGSMGVFYAVTVEEAMLYVEFLQRITYAALAQEYLNDAEGEFTIGVLSLPNMEVAGSITLRRSLEPKLSVSYRGRGGVISSGYSQGYIDEFPELRRQAESIAQALGSRGPLNIQGRVRDGRLLPFEINPRFSASTYLRALAGFNEVHTLIKFLQNGRKPEQPRIRSGWYLRSLTEQFVPTEKVK
jgi:carbamoyl-phosphate synthase large subunit